MWKRVRFILLVIIFMNFGAQLVLSARLYPEKVYQEYWCKKYGGYSEVKLADETRVDCVLNDYAIEFDFANKWGESIGQSLYYSISLNKKAGVVLIMEDMQRDKRYLARLLKVADLNNITVWTISPDDLIYNISYR